jgi:LuxR family transcriptional regulator, quorum-sensing system regulator SolR
MATSFEHAGELELLSHITNGVRLTTDVGDRLKQLLYEISDAVPFNRAVVVHEHGDKTISRGFVYWREGLQESERRQPEQFSHGAAVGLERYVSCFASSGHRDYGFQWRDVGRSLQGLEPVAAELAGRMRGGGGLAAHVHSAAAVGTSTLLQIECADTATSPRQTLLISFIGLCLHSSFMMQMANPLLKDQILGINLTCKERDVLKWMVEGKTSWEIGQILSTSERTVKFHLKNVYTKLNVSNRAQAAAMVNQLGLV